MPSEQIGNLIALFARIAGGGGLQGTPHFCHSCFSSTSTLEEMEALINGNNGSTESWVSDERLAIPAFSLVSSR